MTIAGETRAKVDRLIRDFYPWGEDGYLPGTSPRGVRQRLERVKGWLAAFCTPFRVTALTLIARVLTILDELERSLGRTEPARWRARIDAGTLVKTPDSILEKMVRGWEPDQPNPPCDFRRLHELNDLSRFRIVVNFLSDLEHIASALEQPYGRPGRRLTAPQKALHDEFRLLEGRFQDSVLVHPKDRTKGERGRKGVFEPREKAFAHHYVEVQIQTQLQEAWDKKDHFLVYEPRRRGEAVVLADAIEIFAMSELLYVADLTFDRLREEILNRQSKAAKTKRPSKRGKRRASTR